MTQAGTGSMVGRPGAAAQENRTRKRARKEEADDLQTLSVDTGSYAVQNNLGGTKLILSTGLGFHLGLYNSTLCILPLL